MLQKCSSTAQLFSQAAQVVCLVFQDAQREACTCVDESRVHAAMYERLEYFLEANGAPTADRSAEVVETLLSKYADQGPAMFLHLLRKYPHALAVDATRRSFVDKIFVLPKGDGGPAISSGGDPKRAGFPM